jgi:transposase
MGKHQSKILQHLGVVAGVCDEIHLAELIDARIAQPRRKVSVGQAVKAMILNALGFSGRALYLNPRFYENRPVEVLIGEGLTPEDLHDASLGTALDALYEHGITEVFYHVASAVAKGLGIETRFAHLDSTTFSLHGVYNSDDEEVPEPVVHITKGYSKDNAPDLNQVVAQLICANRTSIPLWLEVLSGNTNDKKSFKATVKEFQKQFKRDEMPYLVMDAAFYTKDAIAEVSEEVRWVSRVPETVKEVKELYATIEKESMKELKAGYRYTPVRSFFGDVPQRWLVVFSEQAYTREMNTFRKNLAKERERNEKDLKHLRNREFACEADALSAAKAFADKLRHQRLSYTAVSKDYYTGKGRPKKDAAPEGRGWFITGALADDEQAIGKTEGRKGMFVIATNELDDTALSDEQLLRSYKDQGVSVERGFRFLKDPWFYAESLYLKKPERVMALIMVMTLSLLVYSVAEMKIRKVLKQKKEHIWDQKKRPTDNPTVRWVFYIFEDVLLLYTIHGAKKTAQAMNIREEHKILLRCLGKPYEKMYFL